MWQRSRPRLLSSCMVRIRLPTPRTSCSNSLCTLTPPGRPSSFQDRAIHGRRRAAKQTSDHNNRHRFACAMDHACTRAYPPAGTYIQTRIHVMPTPSQVLTPMHTSIFMHTRMRMCVHMCTHTLLAFRVPQPAPAPSNLNPACQVCFLLRPVP